MKISRSVQMKTEDICIGDQITVKLKGMGKYTATAQQITSSGIWFLFDEAIVKMDMNDDCTNAGGFMKSKLKQWIDGALYFAFPAKLRKRLLALTLPSYGQIFGHDKDDDFYSEYVEPDEDEQFPMMKVRKKRIASFENEPCWWWIRNAIRKERSGAYFADVNGHGGCGYAGASGSGGVRPAFLLAKITAPCGRDAAQE